MEELICLPRFSVSSGEGSKTPAFPDRVPSDWLRGTLAATEAPLLPPRGGSPATGIGGRFRERHRLHRHRVRRVTEHRRARVQHASLGGSLLPWRTESTGPPGTSGNPSPSTAVPSTTGPTGHYGPLRSDGAASSGDSFSPATRQCPRPRARCCSGPCRPCPDPSPRLLCTQGCQCGVP